MCGVAGFYNASVDQQVIAAVQSKLKHRGPDEQQVYLKKDVGLLHSRLSIIELSSLGSQPYKFENLVLILNGELYNYKEVREDLKKRGYHFISNSDTEVLIKAFHCWKEKCVDHFIGMFAFCVYDEQHDELFLFRDRVGIKPLYYSYQNNVLYFASELKALLPFGIKKEINPDAVWFYFRFGFIPSHHSIYRSVNKLEPGHFIKVSRDEFCKKKYWSLPHESTVRKRDEEWLEELEPLLMSAFQYRMVSDVPVGVFLSGGVDSSLLTALLQKHQGGIHSFTIGFQESEFDESGYAQKVASHLGTHHTQKKIGIEEAKDILSNFYSIYDEPFSDTSGIPVACVSQLAKDHRVKVVLSADGGDELFGGYTHYQSAAAMYRQWSTLPLGARKVMAKSSRALFTHKQRVRSTAFNLEHKVYAFEELVTASNSIDFFESYLANQTTDELSNMLKGNKAAPLSYFNNGENMLQSFMNWDFQYYLPDDLLVKVDRATMFYGIECRDPFLDHRLVEWAARLPIDQKIRNGKGKHILRQLLSKYLPPIFFERQKQGFSIPIFKWFSSEFDLLFNEYLTQSRLSKIPFLRTEEILREHRKYTLYKAAGKEYNIEKMWRILSFMLWWDKYQEHAS